jgi:hypothetical protein
MNRINRVVAFFAGALFGVLALHVYGAKAQDPKLPNQLGRITITPISPNGKVTLYPTERYLNFACSQTQCYVATMD